MAFFKSLVVHLSLSDSHKFIQGRFWKEESEKEEEQSMGLGKTESRNRNEADKTFDRFCEKRTKFR